MPEIVDIDSISDEVLESMYFAKCVEWRGVQYVLVNNSMQGVSCLIRAFIAKTGGSLLFAVYVPPGSKCELPSQVHVLERLRDEDGVVYFEEGIEVDLKTRVLTKVGSGNRHHHHHHGYDSFILQRGADRILGPTNIFCPNPLVHRYLTYKNVSYRYACTTAADIKDVALRARVFKDDRDSNRIVLVASVEGVEGSLPRWIPMTREDSALNVYFAEEGSSSSYDMDSNLLYL
jgi:hypothetical protein